MNKAEYKNALTQYKVESEESKCVFLILGIPIILYLFLENYLVFSQKDWVLFWADFAAVLIVFFWGMYRDDAYTKKTGHYLDDSIHASPSYANYRDLKEKGESRDTKIGFAVIGMFVASAVIAHVTEYGFWTFLVLAVAIFVYGTLTDNPEEKEAQKLFDQIMEEQL